MKKLNSKLTIKNLCAGIAAALVAIAIVFAVLAPTPKGVDARTLKVTDVSFNSIELTWKEVSNAAEYYIYRSEDGQRFEHVGTADKNTYVDRGLETGEKYLYKIVSSNYIKISEQEAKAKGVTKIDTPVISGDTRTGKVRITISNVAGAKNYIVERDGEPLKTIAATDGADTQFTDESAEADKSYTYSVTACRDEDRSDESDELKSTSEVKAAIDVDKLVFSWEPDDAFTSYKVYNGTSLLAETKEPNFSMEAKDGTYDIKLTGYGSGVKGVTREQTFKVGEEKLTPEEVVEAAINWGTMIGEDNSFHYGKKPWSVHLGCYFCGTNQPSNSVKARKGGSYSQREKTWACCEFVTACFVHGAKLQGIDCKKNYIGTLANDNHYLKGSADWKRMGNISYSDLKRGDVIMTSIHTTMYIGNGQVVESTGGDNGVRNSKKWNYSIGVHDYPSSKYHKRKAVVWRFVGNGPGAVGLTVRDITGEKEKKSE